VSTKFSSPNKNEASLLSSLRNVFNVVVSQAVSIPRIRFRNMAQSHSQCYFTNKTPEQLHNENFRRQNITFVEKADRLRKEFGADMFVLIRRKGKLTVYTSRDSLIDSQWPLQLRDITDYYPKTMKTPETIECRQRNRNLRIQAKTRNKKSPKLCTPA
jgi:hypothetical protein